MILDQTRFDAFWRNPEKYRLTYELNLVPKVMAYGLARGTAAHIIEEEKAMGQTRATIDRILRGEIEGHRGKVDPLDTKAINMAWALCDALDQHPSSAEIRLIPEGCEREFLVPIPGSPHSMAGRIDQIIERRGALWVGEFKTANPRAQYERFLDDWNNKKQADFLILGARSLGFDIDLKTSGVYVRQVVEGNPPRIWELEAKRSPHALQVTMLNVHQTCEIIEMLRTTFGVDVPWPHICYLWPCSVPGKCEYESLCTRQASTLTEADLEGFKTREEHLGIIRRLNEEAKCKSETTTQV